MTGISGLPDLNPTCVTSLSPTEQSIPLTPMPSVAVMHLRPNHISLHKNAMRRQNDYLHPLKSAPTGRSYFACHFL